MYGLTSFPTISIAQLLTLFSAHGGNTFMATQLHCSLLPWALFVPQFRREKWRSLRTWGWRKHCSFPCALQK